MAGLLIRIGVLGTGLSIFGVTAYVTAISYAPAPTYTVSDADRERKFEEIAPKYEDQTKNQEFYLGIRNMRRQMVKEAKGDVLEIGAGTGTMVGLYAASDEAEEIFVAALDENAKREREEKKAAKRSSKRDGMIGPKPLEQVETERGTAANLADGKDFVPGVRTVTMSDRAGNMLTQLEEKIQGRVGYTPHRILEKEAGEWKPGHYVLPVSPSPLPRGPTASGTDKHPLYMTAQFSSEQVPFPDNSFDTVIDVFGLCSYDDPVRALLEMSRVCKPDGEILLLEHGRGTWSRVNMQLDKWAPRHARSWGCWWNRDIRRYLRLAGLTKITRREEKHMGTTHRIAVKPNKSWMGSRVMPPLPKDEREEAARKRVSNEEQSKN